MADIGWISTLRAMRRPIILLGFVAGVFLAGALVAPWVYRALHALTNVSEEFASFPRVVSRVLMVLTAIGLWPLMKGLRASWREIGVSRPDWPNAARGALLALVSLGAFIAIASLLDGRDWRRNATGASMLQAAALAALAAVLVAPMEEFFFRGVIFGLLRGRRRWMLALVLSGAFFAVVHFLQTPRAAMEVQWFSGFEVLRDMLLPARSAAGQRAAQFVNLSLCGALLAWAYQRSGNLWFSIGLHAGWIYWLKFANALTIVPRGAHEAWGTRKVIDGWGVTLLLLATCALLPLLARRRISKSSHGSHGSNAVPPVE